MLNGSVGEERRGGGRSGPVLSSVVGSLNECVSFRLPAAATATRVFVLGSVDS